jgi:hypothetical protein
VSEVQGRLCRLSVRERAGLERLAELAEQDARRQLEDAGFQVRHGSRPGVLVAQRGGQRIYGSSASALLKYVRPVGAVRPDAATPDGGKTS